VKEIPTGPVVRVSEVPTADNRGRISSGSGALAQTDSRGVAGRSDAVGWAVTP
jgi:hypothetical protein